MATDPRAQAVDDVTHLFDVPLVQDEDVAAAVVFLASDGARYITGVALPADTRMLAGQAGQRAREPSCSSR